MWQLVHWTCFASSHKFELLFLYVCICCHIHLTFICMLTKKLKWLHQATWRGSYTFWLRPLFTPNRTLVNKHKSNQTNRNLPLHLMNEKNVTTIDNQLGMLKFEQVHSRVQMHWDQVENVAIWKSLSLNTPWCNLGMKPTT